MELEHADDAMKLLKRIDEEYQFIEPYGEAVRMVEAEMDRLYKEVRELRGALKRGKGTAA